MIARTGFYIKVKVKSSKGIPLVIVISIAVTALKIGDVLTYSLVPFFLCIVYKPISRFAAYKALFALIAVLTIRGIMSLVRRVVLSVSIK